MTPSLPLPAAIALAAAAVIACSRPSGSEAEPVVREISMDEVERSLGTPNFHVFDVNGPDLYEKHRVPGARNAKSREIAGAVPADKSAKLVFYCTNPS